MLEDSFSKLHSNQPFQSYSQQDIQSIRNRREALAEIQIQQQASSCSSCHFKFPTAKHLNSCSNCNYEIKKPASDLQTNQFCNKCQLNTDAPKNNLDIYQDQENKCPMCSQYLDWNNEYTPYDKSRITSLSQFRMVIPCLLYVIGLPRKYGNENIIRSSKFFGQYGNI